MPVTQLFMPANPYALTDHTLLKSEEMLFLEREKILSITDDECNEIQLATIGQHSNNMWKKQRTLRLTSSTFGRICKSTSRTDHSRLAETMVSPQAFSGRAVGHGLQYESVAVQQFEAMYGATEKCGLFVCKHMPWLSASPDRILSSDALLEVKCPFTAKDKPITPTTVPYLKEKGNSLNLDRTHPYFYQVQGQLLCAGRKKCYFCVYTHKELKILEIVKDDEFISDMVPVLKNFFDNFFLPAVLQRYVYRGYDKYNWSDHLQ